MIAYNLIKNISIDVIESQSSEFSLEYYDPDSINDELEMLKEFGLLIPPVLIPKNNSYEVILGKKTVDCCRILGKDISSGIVVTDLPDEYGFLKVLILIKRETKGFNVIEKAMTMKRAFDLVHKVESSICSLLDIPRNEKYIQNFLLLARAPDDIKLLILRGMLHENTAFEIFRFPEESWIILSQFISRLFLGTKKRNEIIHLLYPITDGSVKKIESFLKNEKLKKILHLNIDPPQIAERIYDFIKEMRYPCIAEYKKKFFKKLKEVDIDKEFRFNIPKDFENWEFTISVPFSSQEDLKCKLNKLKKIADKKSFGELMSMHY